MSAIDDRLRDANHATFTALMETWRRRLPPRVAAEVSSLNSRLETLRRITAALMSRRNVLVRGSNPWRGKSP